MDHISSTHDMFSKDSEPSTRYFHQDGIHLTASRTKRLSNALNRGFQILKDFDNCVFTGKRNMNKAVFMFHSEVTRDSFKLGESRRLGDFLKYALVATERATRSRIAGLIIRDSALLPITVEVHRKMKI